MTEQDLKGRLEALDNQRRQMEANLNAIAGAMQECQFWLDKLNGPAHTNSVATEDVSLLELREQNHGLQ